jgi:CheY-like chemotaxis protein
MQLDYRILWFDDQAQAIKPFVDRVQSMIARLGFEPKVDLRIITADVAEPLANLPPQAEVDLVLMDYKLGGQHDGADLAQKLRVTFRDTDFIFYSSEPPATLRQLIFDKGIDGVFCVSRQNLSDRANGIIQGQLRRVLDLNHMRGIVMAATSDLDLGMIDCLDVVQKILHVGDEAVAAYAGEVAARISKSMRSKADDIDELGKKGKIAKLLREPSFGALLRLQLLQEEIAKLADKLGEQHVVEGLGKYHEEVITPRNDFAHRKAHVKDGKLHLEGRSDPLDHNSMKALRLRLLAHADNLRGLLSSLQELAGVAGEPALAREIAKVEAAVEEAAEAAAGAPSQSPPGPG